MISHSMHWPHSLKWFAFVMLLFAGLALREQGKDVDIWRMVDEPVGQK